MRATSDDDLVLTRDEHERIRARSVAVFSAIVGVALAVGVESSWGRGSTGATPLWVAGVTGAWLLASIVVTSFLGNYQQFAAPVSSQRDLEIYSTIFYCSVFGATSSFEVSPAYAFLLAATINLGWLLVQRRPLTLAIVAVVPLALRFVAVPDASLASYGVALGAGVLVVGGVLLWGRRCERDHAIRLALEAEAAALEAQREAGAGMRAAMSLHDGLSGAVLVLQAHLAAASHYDATRSAVRVMVGRVRALVEGNIGHPLEVLAADLPRVARWLDASCTLRVDPAIATLSIGERRDLGELAWEAAMNALRRGRSVITLTLAVDASSVTLGCDGRGARTPSGASGGGRGLRYAAARALARGGVATLSTDGTFVARWPRHEGPASNALTVPVAFGTIFVLAMLIGELSGHRSASWLGAFGALGAAGAYYGMAQAGQAERAKLDAVREESLAFAEREVMRGVRGLLEPSCDALVAADDVSSLDDARAAAMRLATAIGDSLRLLEQTTAPSP